MYSYHFDSKSMDSPESTNSDSAGEEENEEFNPDASRNSETKEQTNHTILTNSTLIDEYNISFPTNNPSDADAAATSSVCSSPCSPSSSPLLVWRCPSFHLESGIILRDFPIAFQTFGELNSTRSNALLIIHALTGNSNVIDWWGELEIVKNSIQTNNANTSSNSNTNTNKNSTNTFGHFIICSNILGSCYGSIGPSMYSNSLNRPFGLDFPLITVRDAAAIQLKIIQEYFKLNELSCIIGGSLGGMIGLELLILNNYNNSNNDNKNSFKNIENRIQIHSAILLSCSARQSAWALGLNHIQRQAIELDQNWNNGRYSIHQRPTNGLSIARQLAMMSYRTQLVYTRKFDNQKNNNNINSNNIAINNSPGIQFIPTPVASPPSASASALESAPTIDTSSNSKSLPSSLSAASSTPVASYLNYQGRKFNDRFDAATYYRLTEMLDSHDITRNREGNLSTILNSIEIPTLIIGMSSDALYPIEEQLIISSLLSFGEFISLETQEGHDGFLLEQIKISPIIQRFIDKHNNNTKNNENNNMKNKNNEIQLKTPKSIKKFNNNNINNNGASLSSVKFQSQLPN